MDLSEFLLRDFRKKNFDKEVWVPLRVSLNESEGTFGSEGKHRILRGNVSGSTCREDRCCEH